MRPCPARPGDITQDPRQLSRREPGTLRDPMSSCHRAQFPQDKGPLCPSPMRRPGFPPRCSTTPDRRIRSDKGGLSLAPHRGRRGSGSLPARCIPLPRTVSPASATLISVVHSRLVGESDSLSIQRWPWRHHRRSWCRGLFDRRGVFCAPLEQSHHSIMPAVSAAATPLEDPGDSPSRGVEQGGDEIDS